MRFNLAMIQLVIYRAGNVENATTKELLSIVQDVPNTSTTHNNDVRRAVLRVNASADDSKGKRAVEESLEDCLFHVPRSVAPHSGLGIRRHRPRSKSLYQLPYMHILRQSQN